MPVQLKNAILGELPGLEAQMTMCTIPRPGMRSIHDVEGKYREAGVLLLLYIHKDEWHLVLTKRTDELPHHRGQISLPGGTREPSETLEETALRETEEELGISVRGLDLIGSLTPLYIPPSSFVIHPFVAVNHARPRFHPSPIEVAELLEVPLVHLIQDINQKVETWFIRGKEIEVPFYRFNDYKIWGATAMVLAEFLVIIKQFMHPEQ